MRLYTVRPVQDLTDYFQAWKDEGILMQTQEQGASTAPTDYRSNK